MTKIYDQDPEYAGIPWKIAWRNEGEKMQFLNWNTPLDSAALAQRDTIMWPNVANWASSLTPEYVESIAQYFEPNRKELLPIHQSILDANPNLKNDYGY
ncbi:MAG TPA: hypothetical protein VE912_14935 [Bacteroidales bacterium]|nr:hypothetical protein [Bacteroidales bacterium]